MTTQFIINHLWQSSCFVPLAALVAFVLRKNAAKVRYWVWLGASLKFLVPFALLVSLGSVIPQPARRAVTGPAPIFPNTVLKIAEPFSPTSYTAVPAHAPLRWAPVAIGTLWAIGFLAITLARCRSWFRIRATLRASTLVKLPIPVPAFVSAGVEEPGVVGFLRPILVLPAQLLEHLNPRQLHAVLVHELCHVRRRDNFFAAVHMVVEAVFWFHPLVWWIGSRMVEERELACDEEVMRTGCEPADYVEGILKVCRFYTESALPCVSGVTGADVKKRLRTILAGSTARELQVGKKVALTVVALGTLAAPIVIGVMNAPRIHAQDNATRPLMPMARDADPAFEVAAIKPADPSDTSQGFRLVGRRISVEAMNMTGLICFAYSIQKTQIINAPQWFDEEPWNIEGIPDTEGAPNWHQYRQMLQKLLSTRFGLVMHHDKRELSVYTLTVAKGGPKLEKSKSDPSALSDQSGRGGGTTQSMKFTNDSMTEFAQTMQLMVDRPVVDQTNLSGRYDFTMLWTFDAVHDTPTDAAPGLFTAVQEQLGLKLTAARIPTDVFVIDVATRPTEN